MFANPKFANTARIQTIFLIFENLNFQGIGQYVELSKYFRIFSENIYIRLLPEERDPCLYPICT